MELYVNNINTEVTLENEKTVGDVLTSFQEYCNDKKLATIHITIDSNEITAEKFDTITSVPLKENTKIELVVISQKEIKAEFKSLKNDLITLNEKILQIPSELQNGQDKNAAHTISELATALDNYCHITALSALFPASFIKYQIGEKNVQEFFADFSNILKDYEQGLESKDTVMVSDLSEYEISPRLNEIIGSLENMND